MLSLTARHAGMHVLSHPWVKAGAVLPTAGHRLPLRPEADTPGPGLACLRERRLHTAQGLWLGAEHQPDGPQETIEAGRQAQAALRREVPAQQGRHSAQRAALAEQSQRALFLQPHLHTALLASSMLAGLEQPLSELVVREAPGIAHGLRLLALKPGDAVAECDPGDLALPVHLALTGCRVTLLHSDMLTGARLWDEVEAYARGAPRGQPRQRPDGSPWLPPAQYRERALQAASHLAVVQVRDLPHLPGQGAWRALLSRGTMAFRFQGEDLEDLKAASRLLAPGGGLLFRMPHAAGEREEGNAGWARRRHPMGELEDMARRHGLNLRCAHLTYDSPGVQSGTLLAPRQVAPECSGWVDFHNVDAAAWDGWSALQRDTWVQQHPMTVEVSGLLERER